MKLLMKSNRMNKIVLLSVLMGLLLGSGLMGIRVKKYTGSHTFHAEEVIPSELLEKSPLDEIGPQVSAISFETRIVVDPLNLIIVGVLGGLVAYFVAKFIKRKSKPKRDLSRKTNQSDGVLCYNSMVFAGFFVSIILLWLIITWLFLWLNQPLSDTRVYLIKMASAIIALVISVLAVGHRVKWNSWWSDKRDRILLGPFYYIKSPLLSLAQLKVAWIGIVIFLLLMIFPPWQGYEYATGKIGQGEPHFIGFNFWCSLEYDVYSIYTAPEVDYGLLGILSGGIILGCILIISLQFLFRLKRT